MDLNNKTVKGVVAYRFRSMIFEATLNVPACVVAYKGTDVH